LETLRANLPELQRRYSISSLAVFGSYVRGRPRKRSDLDILVEFNTAPTFFQFVELEDHLSQLLGIHVDLVMKKALRPRIGERILAEMVRI
jgi:hypothetical protein